ncbi:hypothetical protein HLK59_20485 [Streptomyces sp. S3(2020)]|uniref:hypothetical protein n=1 Tax=Streptomyces sp. S3(2020) TaxID=2732044 RepID=UPI00148A0F77|nr:hypothetical protein [Streptomyces sp. S3(2020)]NNN32698.1 hypothetical protein [Streptomyces sp. S3(2020)]
MYGTVLSRARLPLHTDRPATATARVVDLDVWFSLRRLSALAVHPERTALPTDGSEQRGSALASVEIRDHPVTVRQSR